MLPPPIPEIIPMDLGHVKAKDWILQCLVILKVWPSILAFSWVSKMPILQFLGKLVVKD